MKLIDFTHKISGSIPVFPGDNPPEIHSIETDYRETALNITSHTGTHVDAPSHMLKNGRMLDDYPIGSFMGTCLCADISAKLTDGDRGSLAITKKELAGALNVAGQADFVLIRTGWSKYWGQRIYIEEIPYLTNDAAVWLSGLGIKGVGIDTISIDSLQSDSFENHSIFMEKEILIIENLANLDKAPLKPFIFSCMPIHYQKADGAPVRAFGITEF